MSENKRFFKNGAGMKGVVERRLFDTKGLIAARQAMQAGASDEEVRILLDKAAKPQFANNGLWKLLYKLFNVDVKIPFLTGLWTTRAIRHNTITDVGLKVIADQLGGTTTVPVTAVAIGEGSPTPTALGSEVTTGGGARGAATVSNTTTDVTGDTEQWIKTFNFSATFAITEEALLDNNTSGGKMLASQSFSAVPVSDGDSLQITHQVQVETP
jgi:hypothetical protein